MHEGIFNVVFYCLVDGYKVCVLHDYRQSFISINVYGQTLGFTLNYRETDKKIRGMPEIDENLAEDDYLQTEIQKVFER